MPLLTLFVRLVRFLPPLSLIMLILAWNAPLISPIFLKWSLVFPILLIFPIFCIVHLSRLSFLLLFSETLHSVGFIFPLLLCFSLIFFSHLCAKPPQTTILPFHIFLWVVLVTPSWTMLWASVHSSSGTLSIRSSPLNLFVTSAV